MANICSFYMRVSGTKANCYEFLENGFRHCYDTFVKQESGSEEHYLLCLEGECRWNVTNSMIYDKDDGSFQSKTLCEKSKLLSLEIEVVGFDISEPEWIEHFHYNCGECLRYYNLYPYVQEDFIDELDEIDRSKYNYLPEHEIYVLDKEYEEEFEWDFDQERMIVNFSMPSVLETELESESVTEEFESPFLTVDKCPDELAILEELFSKYSDEDLAIACENSIMFSPKGIHKNNKPSAFNKTTLSPLFLEMFLEDGGLSIMKYTCLYNHDLKKFKSYARSYLKRFMKENLSK